MMPRALGLAGLVVALAPACASQPRFRDQPIVWRVDDKSIPQPEENRYNKYEYMGDVFFLRRSTRALELNTYQLAQGTNALDEVPDSSWFNNRIGVRDVSPQEAAKGVETNGPPVLPWKVVAGKVGGGNPGFVAEDASGRKFVVKFDTAKNPEQQTSTDVIVGRIFWTLGFNVPSDYISVFAREDLTIADDAKMSAPLEDKRKMTEADVDGILATAPKRLDGKYRAIASEFLPGKPLGGVTPEGLRDDDPNDVIPHEHRRELRSMAVIGAWLNHTDMKEDNTLDVYVEKDGKKFVRHYFIDFGEAFGAHASEKGRLEDGYEHFWDWKKQTLGFLSLGFWVRQWEYLEMTPWPAVGAYTWEHFSADNWREAYPYWPIVESGVEDWFWAAKLIMRVDRPILEAVVKEGQLSVPEAAEHLVTTLLRRRDILGKEYIEMVTPLDRLTSENGALCGLDLGVHYGFAEAGASAIDRLDDDDDVLGRHPVEAGGRVCIDVPTDESYTIIRLQARRRDDTRPVMQVHMKGGRILGLVRVER